MHKIHEEVFQLLMKYHKKDENFLFTMRQINRGGKLDKGYWFLGNDDYLAVSFWSGTDHLAKTPRIFFQIYKDGSSSLELRNEDVFGHIDFFPDQLIKKLGAEENDSSISIPLKKDNYLESLHSFIENEKVIIDKFVRNYDINTATEWSDPIEFIYPGDFKKQLDRIRSYQQDKKKREGESGFLKNIHIQNFGPIQDIHIENIESENRWIFLTGENGAGKTSLLKAIAVGLCQNNDGGEIVKSDDGFKDFSIKLQLHEWNGDTPVHTITAGDQIEGRKCLAHSFAAYGPVRLLTEGSLDSNLFKEDLGSIVDKLTYGLFYPVGILRDLSRDYPLVSKPKNLEMDMEAMTEHLTEIIPDYYAVRDSEGEMRFKDTRIKEDSIANQYSLDQLPSGTRNLVALVLDLLVRLQNQQPRVYDPSNYNGVVLIDEIDIHLHPKLQIWLIEQLKETFPKVQFIVSTHSPVALLGAPKNSLVYTVKHSPENGVSVTRLDDKLYLDELLPNTLLTSPIFGMEDIFPSEFKGEKPARTEVDYSELILNDAIDKRIENFLSDRKEKELIERIQNRRKS